MMNSSGLLDNSNEMAVYLGMLNILIAVRLSPESKWPLFLVIPLSPLTFLSLLLLNNAVKLTFKGTRRAQIMPALMILTA